MKKRLITWLLAATGVATLSAATPLHIGYVSGTISTGPCWYDSTIGPGTTGGFAISGLTGTGEVSSYVLVTVNPPPPAGTPIFRNLFVYTLDLTGMSPAAEHCVRLSIPFGMPATCDFDSDTVPDQVLVLSGGAGTPIASATLSGNVVEIVFQDGPLSCLVPGNQSVTFAMLSDRPIRTNVVTVTDVQGKLPGTNTVNVTARALVPNLPPFLGLQIKPHLQGLLRGQNGLPLNGLFDLRLLLHDAETNGLPASEAIIETVSVQNGLFNAPLSFNPSTFHEKARWLSVAVRPAGANDPFTNLASRLPIAPAPASLYANAAGHVMGLAPGQAVTSLNGLTDAVTIGVGQGLVLQQQGNQLILSAAQQSDRNRKADFVPVLPSEVLARVMALPLQTWRYTNEVTGVRHLGPMAQDFYAAFALGDNNTTIATVDADGVALAAIQGLNQKVEAKDAEIRSLKSELEQLKEVVNKLANAKEKP